MIHKITLQRVHYMPKDLSEGVLYVSEEYKIAGHLCACGCGSRVMTPLSTTEWSFKDEGGLPSLRPSIGNWQLPCRSHYVISGGVVRWAGQWTDEQIAAGRRGEELRREAYFRSREPRGIAALWAWIRRIFKL